VLATFRLETDIGHFLPGGDDDVEVRLAKELSLGELSRTSLLLIEAPDTDSAVRASMHFEKKLRNEPRVNEHLAFLEGGPSEGLEEALWELYQPRRFAFFAEDPTSAAASLTEASLREAAVHLKKQLALPLSTLVTRVAPEDPTLILPRLFKKLSGRGEGLQIVDGCFLTDDGRAAILFIGTHESATPGSKQRSFQEGLHAAFERAQAADAGEISLLQSGVGRFALSAEESMRRDIRRVSIGSMLGLTLFFLVLFRSLRLVLMVLPIIGAGFLAGTSACLFFFSSIHGITLAFGAAMIGVSIDYAVHFHGHWILAPVEGSPRATLLGLWRGLFLSAATTVTGFLALSASDFLRRSHTRGVHTARVPGAAVRADPVSAYASCDLPRCAGSGVELARRGRAEPDEWCACPAWFARGEEPRPKTALGRTHEAHVRDRCPAL